MSGLFFSARFLYAHLCLRLRSNRGFYSITPSIKFASNHYLLYAHLYLMNEVRGRLTDYPKLYFVHSSHNSLPSVLNFFTHSYASRTKFVGIDQNCLYVKFKADNSTPSILSFLYTTYAHREINTFYQNLPSNISN